MTDPPRQLDLLDAARAVQRAATDGDVDTLHGEVCRLRNALVEHVADRELGDGEGVQRRLARHGQQRLLHFIDELLSTTHESAESCTCLVRGAELRSLLIRQLRLEAVSSAGEPRR
ncbi:hypothetical protein NHL50_04975 [Acidimicrobiia bacterium EGI L10123]|nr:hypothetical protein [Acidimicrobiia bacterium EGI L10123]